MKLYIVNEYPQFVFFDGFACLAETKSEAIKRAVDELYDEILSDVWTPDNLALWIDENMQEYPVDQPVFVAF